MTDIAYALHRLVPGAEYRGSTTDNTQAAYDALVWLDSRAKPTWSEIEANGDSTPTPTERSDLFESYLLQSDVLRLFAKALARDLSMLVTRLSNGQSIPAATEQQIMQRWKQYVEDGLIS